MSLDLTKFIEYKTVEGIDVGDLLDQRNGLLDECRRLQAEVKSLRAFKADVDEALNSGDGVYRP